MIKEEYVSFEVAKLLKEKGFNESCSFVVNKISKCVMPVSWPTTNSDIEDDKANLIALPTHQMAMAWLREVHYLWIDIEPLTNYKWTWSIWLMNDSNLKMGESSQVTSTYEETVEAALKYVLENLI